MPTLRTIASAHRIEIDKIKGSRFIADVGMAGTDDAAQDFLQSVRDAFPDASHHCSAWRIDDETSRANDDGEPSGSAGRPILQRIDHLDLVHVIVVVTRYFGGTKLGTGGLIRAYGAAAAAVLEDSEIVETIVKRRLALTFDYELSGTIKGILSAHDLTPTSSDYGATVHIEVALPVEDVEAFVADVTERTAGRVTPVAT